MCATGAEAAKRFEHRTSKLESLKLFNPLEVHRQKNKKQCLIDIVKLGKVFLGSKRAIIKLSDGKFISSR